MESVINLVENKKKRMILKIYSQIASDTEKAILQFWGENAVSFTDIDDFIDKMPTDDDTIEVRIHCPGGDVAEGWAIVDKLRATGKKIVTIVDGVCASMATVVLLAGSIRKGYKNQRLLIHNTRFCDLYIEQATAEELESKAMELKEEDNRIVDFYVERTGADRQALVSLMEEERYITMEEAKELGFITEIIEPISAIYKSKKNKMNRKTLKAAFNSFAQALGLGALKDIELTAEDGTVLTVEREDGDPEVGDAASPDGEFLMADGKTIVVVDGSITEIREAETTPGEDVEALNAEISKLRAELEAEKSKGKTEEEKDILAKVAKAGGKAWLEKSIVSNYTPPKVSPIIEKKSIEKTAIQKELEERRMKAKERAEKRK